MRVTLNNRDAGFSLIEVMVTMVLMVAVSTALMGYHRVLIQGFDAQWQYRLLWRIANAQADIVPPGIPAGWQVKRGQTSAAGCVSITVNVTNPAGRHGQLTRRHCSVN